MSASSSYQSRDQYWASLPAPEIANEIHARINTYYQFLLNSGLLVKLRKSYSTYFGHTPVGFFNSSSDVAMGGETGELSLVKINHYRNLLQHLLVLVTQNKPAVECRAANTDVQSQAQTILASSILDYYMQEKRLDRQLKKATEISLVFGEGYIVLEWDTSLGNPYGVSPETGTTIYEGDVKFSCPMGPLDVIKDLSVRDGSEDVPWYIVTEYVNRYDLMAKYPAFAEEIKGLSLNALNNFYGATTIPGVPIQSDLVPLFKFYHRKSPALPNGRMVYTIDGKTVLFDGPLPYNSLPHGLPIFRIAPSDFFGTPFGYSAGYDLIGISEVVDSLYSAVTTNQTSFAVQNILVPKGHDLSMQQLSGGLNLLEYEPKLGPPQSLNLTHTPPEVFNFINKLETVEGLLAGINDVVRGDPQASLKSGSALALVASQALQFNSGLAASYNALLEDVMTGVLRMLQTFATTRRVASLVGRSKKGLLVEFSNQDIRDVSRVIVQQGSALAATPSGRLQIAQDLIQMGALKNPHDYLQVLETGNLEVPLEGTEQEMLTIKDENEYLQQGNPVKALVIDNHAEHIHNHKCVLGTAQARMQPDVVQATLAHIQEHIDLLRTSDPGLLAVLGQQPLPPPPPPPGMMPPGQPGQPMPTQAGPGAPVPVPSPIQHQGGPQPPSRPHRAVENRPLERAKAGTQNPPQVLQAQNPVTQAAAKVRFPTMPRLPATGVK